MAKESKTKFINKVEYIILGSGGRLNIKYKDGRDIWYVPLKVVE